MQIYGVCMILSMFLTTDDDGCLTKKTRSRNTGLAYVFQVLDRSSRANPWPLVAFSIDDLGKPECSLFSFLLDLEPSL